MRWQYHSNKHQKMKPKFEILASCIAATCNQPHQYG